MKKLPLEAIGLAECLVEGKVAVLSIHDHRIAELSEGGEASRLKFTPSGEIQMV